LHAGDGCVKELIEALKARGGELADRSIEEMYRDPFWLLRYGEGGRKYALEDGRRHLSYLIEAPRRRCATRADPPRKSCPYPPKIGSCSI
jgi:hypothetical protein